jgi:NAD(P) transhydrogenase subunit alpha
MIVAVPEEGFPGEKRVALIPASVPGLVRAGLEVRVQSGAGLSAGYSDREYLDRGASTVENRRDLFLANIILQVRTAGANPQAGLVDLEHFRKDQVVIGMCDPLATPQAARSVAARGVTLFALELLPRITRAQSMDVLSSMATVAGYRAVLLAAAALPKMFPLLMTAAGTVAPAKVFVMGVGVAGLQAIATARRLGAVVSANDIRPAVKEQVESLGAKFVQLEFDTAASEDKGGYAKEMDEESLRKQREMIARVVADSDVVITTAAVPGKKAPTLLAAETVARMSPGSVIVDVAAERGGNCELTRPGETVVENGVTILGPTNLPGEVPYHASQMYSKNISTFLLHLVKEGRIELDLEDEIVCDTLIARDGRIVNARVCELLGMEPSCGAEESPEGAGVDEDHPAGDDEYKIAEGEDD